MRNRYAWEFSKGVFSESERFEDEGNLDWNEYLDSLGWIHAFKLGEESISVLEIDCWQKMNSGEFLVDVWNGAYGMGMVVCPSFPDLLIFTERFLSPLVSLSSRSRITDILSQFEEKLLDSDTGLPAARRYEEAAIRRRRFAK